MGKFSSLSATKKNQIIILICATLLAGYFGVWYPIKSEGVAFSENMVNRRMNRIKVKAGNVEMPKVSARKLEEQLKKLEGELENKDGKLSDLSRKFAPLDTLEDLQGMRLEISQLAKISGLNVLEMGGNKRSENVSMKEIMRRETDNPYGRPIVSLKAQATYGQLLRFTYGLNDLAYSVSIINLDVRALASKKKDEDTAVNGPSLLNINLLIAI